MAPDNETEGEVRSKICQNVAKNKCHKSLRISYNKIQFFVSRVESALEVEQAIEKLKSHKSPGIDQIPAEFVSAGGRTFRSEIH